METHAASDNAERSDSSDSDSDCYFYIRKKKKEKGHLYKRVSKCVTQPSPSAIVKERSGKFICVCAPRWKRE